MKSMYDAILLYLTLFNKIVDYIMGVECIWMSSSFEKVVLCGVMRGLCHEFKN